MTHTSNSLLPFLGVLKVTGEDRAAFLHNQLSNDINNLPASQACYATYNTPKGRVLANMLVLNTGDALWLIMAQDLIEVTAKRLRMFVMRSKAVLENASETLSVAGSLQPTDEDFDLPETPPLLLNATEQQDFWRIALPHAGELLVGDTASLPEYHEKSAYQWLSHEINHGYPWIVAANTETCVAQMLNQHLLGGVHFRKGCYPGQEIIARAQYRGQVKRGLVMYGSQNLVEAGEALLDDADEEVGVVINTVPQAMGSLILAVVKHSVGEERLHTEKAAGLDFKRRFYQVNPAS
ncbi:MULTISPECIES: YgfZ/GcvT domain-containing protein [Vitreoscilla]|uniref:Folate-binding protein YgfZ n=1 Tax=Vitreoscilla stercoraria TaxID=61 RepID=A0ABY4E910_VITST|nr:MULTISPECIES: folate-binding protein YgfZ [Vitreoscilla]AUZ04351.2 folate-binding protein YgfZ [Vitreoscilla sp. C1]UOO91919.1 folate-binding protein YgfZ [Vitreoscilla stercoraria]